MPIWKEKRRRIIIKKREKKMKLKNTIILMLLTIFFILQGCISNDTKKTELNNKKNKLLEAKYIKNETEIKTNTLRVIKKENGKIENIEYKKAVTENMGTDKEKICLCQAVAFRVGQLASQAWSDRIFRSYEIGEIRTGWNTDGVYEFFSNKEHNGETGGLEIPIEKILIENINGEQATPGNKLTIKDCWYEITFINGLKLSFRGTEGKDGIYTLKFLGLRSEFKGGDESIKKQMLAERKKVEKNLEQIPFSKIVIYKGGIENIFYKLR